MLIEMEVQGLLFDQSTRSYVVVLREIGGSETLPIWIGEPEANAIALVLGQVAVPRPLSHDLLKNVLDTLDVILSRVVVTEVREGTYYSHLYLLYGNREVVIDSRPSDAIATALRTDSPIYVERDVIDKRHRDDLEEWLRDIKPEDFGNVM
ncbi:MAG: bifunctional nuclease family protein [Thermodesulfovibrionales bacterium]